MTRAPWLIILILSACCRFCLAAPAPSPRVVGGDQPQPNPKLVKYLTPYYDMYTDLGLDDTREAWIRMTKMAEEYAGRTREFSRALPGRMPFYLFRNEEDYYAAGGLPGSAGVFIGKALLAIAGEKTDATTWHVVQHEGFHQFAAATIGNNLPVWANEGLAEYFGESIWTGDGFVSGVIPPWRLKRVQTEIRGGILKSIKEMMLLEHGQWNADLTIRNYDQAWSMVHFLAHGDNGKYQQPFVGFMKAIAHGRQWPLAWQQNLGDASGFEKHWSEWWLAQDKDPSANLYVQAMAATLNSYLARAISQKQTFDSFDSFVAAAKAHELKANREDWLPPSLLDQVVQGLGTRQAKWSLETDEKTPHLLVTVLDGTRYLGQYTLHGNRIAKAWIEIDDTPKILKQAKSLIHDGKKDQARVLLQAALRNHPKSPDAEQAKKMIPETK